jgi:nucleoid DNA-binding protein
MAAKKATAKVKAKKTTTKVTAAAPAAKKRVTGIKTPYNKSQVMTAISDSTELTKKQVSAVIEELSTLMHRHLKKGAAGEFTVPGLMKCVVKRKPATRARKGVNPFTGEEMTFQAKPARNIVKVRPLKKLKEMVE